MIWPHGNWPPIVLSDGLKVGSSGGHGPIRYDVIEIVPLEIIRFRFTGPRGYDGVHYFKLESINEKQVKLVHAIDMKLNGSAVLSWLLIFQPLHDALIEDAFDRVSESVDISVKRNNVKYPFRVRLIMRMLGFLTRLIGRKVG